MNGNGDRNEGAEVKKIGKSLPKSYANKEFGLPQHGILMKIIFKHILQFLPKQEINKYDTLHKISL